MGCRRCLTVGTYIPERRHYCYNNFGQRYRSRPPLRDVEYTIQMGKRFDEAITGAQRNEIRLTTGVCGLGVLTELSSLYDFDPVRDVVIDRMHLCFNLLKKELQTYIWAELGENRERGVNERNPKDGGLICRNAFKEALEKVKWTKQQRATGVPNSKSLTDKLGGWKANEYLK